MHLPSSLQSLDSSKKRKGKRQRRKGRKEGGGGEEEKKSSTNSEMNTNRQEWFCAPQIRSAENAPSPPQSLASGTARPRGPSTRCPLCHEHPPPTSARDWLPHLLQVFVKVTFPDHLLKTHPSFLPCLPISLPL